MLTPPRNTISQLYPILLWNYIENMYTLLAMDVGYIIVFGNKLVASVRLVIDMYFMSCWTLFVWMWRENVWVNFDMRIWVFQLNTLLFTLLLSKMHLTNFRQRCLVTNRYCTRLILNAGWYGVSISFVSCQNSSCYPVRLERSSAFIEISTRQHIVTWNCLIGHFTQVLMCWTSSIGCRCHWQTPWLMGNCQACSIAYDIPYETLTSYSTFIRYCTLYQPWYSVVKMIGRLWILACDWAAKL